MIFSGESVASWSVAPAQAGISVLALVFLNAFHPRARRRWCQTTCIWCVVPFVLLQVK
jgi:hypothetical protein